MNLFALHPWKPGLLGSALLVLLLPSTSGAQQVLSSAGREFTNATRGIAFTIGEPVIATDVSGTRILTQGFHQPSSDISTTIGAISEPAAGVTVYPIPASSELNVVVDGLDDLISIEITDAAGRSVIRHGTFKQRTSLSVEALSSGCYALRLSRNGHPFSTTQLIITR